MNNSSNTSIDSKKSEMESPEEKRNLTRTAPQAQLSKEEHTPVNDAQMKEKENKDKDDLKDSLCDQTMILGTRVSQLVNILGDGKNIDNFSGQSDKKSLEKALKILPGKADMQTEILSCQKTKYSLQTTDSSLQPEKEGCTKAKSGDFDEHILNGISSGSMLTATKCCEKEHNSTKTSYKSNRLAEAELIEDPILEANIKFNELSSTITSSDSTLSATKLCKVEHNLAITSSDITLSGTKRCENEQNPIVTPSGIKPPETKGCEIKNYENDKSESYQMKKNNGINKKLANKDDTNGNIKDQTDRAAKVTRFELLLHAKTKKSEDGVKNSESDIFSEYKNTVVDDKPQNKTGGKQLDNNIALNADQEHTKYSYSLTAASLQTEPNLGERSTMGGSIGFNENSLNSTSSDSALPATECCEGQYTKINSAPNSSQCGNEHCVDEVDLTSKSSRINPPKTEGRGKNYFENAANGSYEINGNTEIINKDTGIDDTKGNIQVQAARAAKISHSELVLYAKPKKSQDGVKNSESDIFGEATKLGEPSTMIAKGGSTSFNGHTSNSISYNSNLSECYEGQNSQINSSINSGQCGNEYCVDEVDLTSKSSRNNPPQTEDRGKKYFKNDENGSYEINGNTGIINEDTDFGQRRSTKSSNSSHLETEDCKKEGNSTIRDYGSTPSQTKSYPGQQPSTKASNSNRFETEPCKKQGLSRNRDAGFMPSGTKSYPAQQHSTKSSHSNQFETEHCKKQGDSINRDVGFMPTGTKSYQGHRPYTKSSNSYRLETEYCKKRGDSRYRDVGFMPSVAKSYQGKRPYTKSQNSKRFETKHGKKHGDSTNRDVGFIPSETKSYPGQRPYTKSTNSKRFETEHCKKQDNSRNRDVGFMPPETKSYPGQQSSTKSINSNRFETEYCKKQADSRNRDVRFMPPETKSYPGQQPSTKASNSKRFETEDCKKLGDPTISDVGNMASGTKPYPGQQPSPKSFNSNHLETEHCKKQGDSRNRDVGFMPPETKSYPGQRPYTKSINSNRFEAEHCKNQGDSRNMPSGTNSYPGKQPSNKSSNSNRLETEHWKTQGDPMISDVGCMSSGTKPYPGQRPSPKSFNSNHLESEDYKKKGSSRNRDIDFIPPETKSYPSQRPSPKSCNSNHLESEDYKKKDNSRNRDVGFMPPETKSYPSQRPYTKSINSNRLETEYCKKQADSRNRDVRFMPPETKSNPGQQPSTKASNSNRFETEDCKKQGDPTISDVGYMTSGPKPYPGQRPYTKSTHLETEDCKKKGDSRKRDDGFMPPETKSNPGQQPSTKASNSNRFETEDCKKQGDPTISDVDNMASGTKPYPGQRPAPKSFNSNNLESEDYKKKGSTRNRDVNFIPPETKSYPSQRRYTKSSNSNRFETKYCKKQGDSRNRDVDFIPPENKSYPGQQPSTRSSNSRRFETEHCKNQGDPRNRDVGCLESGTKPYPGERPSTKSTNSNQLETEDCKKQVDSKIGDVGFSPGTTEPYKGEHLSLCDKQLNLSSTNLNRLESEYWKKDENSTHTLSEERKKISCEIMEKDEINSEHTDQDNTSNPMKNQTLADESSGKSLLESLSNNSNEEVNHSEEIRIISDHINEVLNNNRSNKIDDANNITGTSSELTVSGNERSKQKLDSTITSSNCNQSETYCSKKDLNPYIKSIVNMRSDDISKTNEQTSHGVMGPHFLGFPTNDKAEDNVEIDRQGSYLDHLTKLHPPNKSNGKELYNENADVEPTKNNLSTALAAASLQSKENMAQVEINSDSHILLGTLSVSTPSAMDHNEKEHASTHTLIVPPSSAAKSTEKTSFNLNRDEAKCYASDSSSTTSVLTSYRIKRRESEFTKLYMKGRKGVKYQDADEGKLYKNKNVARVLEASIESDASVSAKSDKTFSINFGIQNGSTPNKYKLTSLHSAGNSGGHKQRDEVDNSDSWAIWLRMYRNQQNRIKKHVQLCNSVLRQ